jgi:hypothetical protein
VKITDRDRRALILLSVFAVIALAIRFWPEDNGAAVVSATQSVPQAEKRLLRIRQMAAAVPGREEALKKLADELTAREKLVLQAETPARAQEQVLQVVRRVARLQQPPLEFRSTELGQPRPFGEHYAEISLTLSADCGIEQIVNFLSDLSNQPEYVATRDITLGAVTSKQKLVPARITVYALVPQNLVAAKKGGA